MEGKAEEYYSGRSDLQIFESGETEIRWLSGFCLFRNWFFCLCNILWGISLEARGEAVIDAFMNASDSISRDQIKVVIDSSSYNQKIQFKAVITQFSNN